MPVKTDAGSFERALGWYVEAMRLYRRAPGRLAALTAIMLAVQIGLELVPEAGSLVAKVVAPLVGCSLVYAADALDRGGRPGLALAWRAFGAPPAAIAAIVTSSSLVFAVEWLAGRALGGVDLLRPASAPPDLSASTVLAIYAAGIAASLPLALVPYAALLEGRGFAGSFAASLAAFARAPVAFAGYGLVAFGLIAAGLATMGLALVIALPLVACATWAAWRDPATRGPSGG